MASATAATPSSIGKNPSFWVLFAVSGSHLLNDLMQSLLPAVYPLLAAAYALDFTQIGLITLVNQLTASVLQPFIGLYTDKNPLPWSLPIAMTSTLAGLLLLAYANTFPTLLVASALIGVGSAIFHPEASRVARMASGGRLGFAQSVFQVGGNAGSAFGPLMAAFVILPNGQTSVAWYALVALTAIILLSAVGRWYAAQNRLPKPAGHAALRTSPVPRGRLIGAFAVIGALLLSKYVYLASMTSYYVFFLMDRFTISPNEAQVYLFVFLGAVAAGTFVGGPVGDRIGRKAVIWVSILGTLPFALALPYMPLPVTVILSAVIGLILASAFSAIVVYAQELLPGRVGMVAGMIFGFAFAMGAFGAALLGLLADETSIAFVFQVCAWLPALGLLTIFLPDVERKTAATSH